MKRFLRFLQAVVLAALLVSPASKAADINFAGIPWDISPSAASVMLQAKGFKARSVDKDGNHIFEGELLGHKAFVSTIYGDGKLVRLHINLATPDRKAREAYKDVRAALIQKYGMPSDTFEFFKKPYYQGDGYEDQAIKLGKARFATFWLPPDGGALGVEISEQLVVSIAYEGPGYEREDAKRQAKARSLL